jgi:endonuclease III related protein
MTGYPCSQKSLSLYDIYEQLLEQYGNQHWWPGKTDDEIIIGAILTQNTNWMNVSKAIQNLKQVNACTLEQCAILEIHILEGLIRPSGFFRIKAVRLQQAVHRIIELRKQSLPLPEFRNALLSIHGIGPETADSILLYAFNLPIFVIDAYTKRIYSRMNLIEERATYHQMQDYFQHSLPNDTQLFNEYHALIVRHAKEACKKKPVCTNCLWGRTNTGG